MKHFTILEIGYDADSPMIGTIDNVPNTPQGIQYFKERLVIALGVHFDSDDIHFLQEFPTMFNYTPYEDLMVSVNTLENDEFICQIRILETFLY